MMSSSEVVNKTEDSMVFKLEPNDISSLPLLSFHQLTSGSLTPLPDVIPASKFLMDYSSPLDLPYDPTLDFDRCPEDPGFPAAASPMPPEPETPLKMRRKRKQAGGKSRRKPVSQDELIVQRNQANVRERQRTQSLNVAFQTLRQIIPTRPCDKLSKIQTLKLASCYINFLWQILKESVQDSEDGKTVSKKRENLSYAFTLWRMQGEYRESARHNDDDDDEVLFGAQL